MALSLQNKLFYLQNFIFLLYNIILLFCFCPLAEGKKPFFLLSGKALNLNVDVMSFLLSHGHTLPPLLLISSQHSTSLFATFVIKIHFYHSSLGIKLCRRVRKFRHAKQRKITLLLRICFSISIYTSLLNMFTKTGYQPFCSTIFFFHVTNE